MTASRNEEVIPDRNAMPLHRTTTIEELKALLQCEPSLSLLSSREESDSDENDVQKLSAEETSLSSDGDAISLRCAHSEIGTDGENSLRKEPDDRSLRRRKQSDTLLLSEFENVKHTVDDITETVEEIALSSVSYMQQREMTQTQERWNAITMLPAPIYSLCYLLSGSWASAALSIDPEYHHDPENCWEANYPVWHHMPSAPPVTILTLVLGITLHAPCSMYYHWTASSRSVHERTIHWTRRLDQAMIHFACAMICMSTSGSWLYFGANCLVNADFFYRQFVPKVQPRRNQLRLCISVTLAYMLPLIRRQLWDVFGEVFILLSISFFLFTRYPIGGWSHTVFHLVMAFTPPLLFKAALSLESSHPALEQAAFCSSRS